MVTMVTGSFHSYNGNRWYQGISLVVMAIGSFHDYYGNK